jgi:ABC-type nitrate/sulfonate/bicarbonate transport system ATPase subunit
VIVMSTRPGRCIADIPVALAHPRDRTAPEFNEYMREIRRLLDSSAGAGLGPKATEAL